MENMWLTAESLGVGMHILTVFADSQVEAEVRRVLKIEPQMKIAFACGLGYHADPSVEDVRVRRDLEDFVHHNAFRQKGVAWSQELKEPPSEEKG
jgi:nitroreductase